MKVILPENIEDIKLRQFQELTLLEAENDLSDYDVKKKKIAIMTNLDVDFIDKIEHSEIDEMVNIIDKALEQTVEFKNKYTYKGVDFGFNPNISKLNGAEFRDAQLYHAEIKDLHKLMAVLFRPIVNTDSFGNYEIEEYNGTEKYAEIMKDFPLSIVNGVLVFFYNLAKELEQHIQASLVQEVAREVKL